MATQTTDSSHRDDAMTAGGPGADSQAPPSFGASNSGTGNGAGDTSEQSASDSENTPAQGAPTTVADSSQPASAQPASTNDGQDTASTSGNAPAPAAGNSDGSANSGNGDNSGGSASAADGSSSATAENSDGTAGAGSGADSALHLAGAGAPLQPIFDAANGVTSDVSGSSGLLHGLVDVADTLGVGAIGATPSADGHSNLITDLVNFPGDAIGGNLNAGLSHIGADLSDTADAATGMAGDVLGGETGGLVSSAAPGASDLLHPATDLIGSAGNDLQTTPLASLDGGGVLGAAVSNPAASSSGDIVQLDSSLVGTNSTHGLLTVNGGNNAGDGGMVGAGIGDLNGSSSGHLVDLAAGPHGDHDSSVGVLTAQPNSGQAATASAVDVGPGGTQLADAGLLTDPGALNIASLNGAGSDSLAGNLLGGSAAETGAGALQPTPVATNLGEVHDIVSVPVTGDHGILDVNQTHII